MLDHALLYLTKNYYTMAKTRAYRKLLTLAKYAAPLPSIPDYGLIYDSKNLRQ